jgi:hypothetical protein
MISPSAHWQIYANPRHSRVRLRAIENRVNSFSITGGENEFKRALALFRSFGDDTCGLYTRVKPASSEDLQQALFSTDQGTAACERYGESRAAALGRAHR